MSQIDTRRLAWVVDDGIPLTPHLQELVGETSVLPGRDINAETVVDADILLVRSITPITRELLERSALKFVGTATAGHDHIDTRALADLGLAWAAAPGFNAISVMEYVLAALVETKWLRAVLEGAPVGVVGLGEVGRRLAERLVAMGATVVAYDPLAEHWPSGVARSEIDVVLRQPVVTLHASLTDTGPYPSRHIIDIPQTHIMLKALAERPCGGLLINAARGGLISESALDGLLESEWTIVLDTWPGEPALSASNLSRCDWISPHIAGHSAQAKPRGSDMLAVAIARWSQHPDLIRIPPSDDVTTSRRSLQVPSIGPDADAIDFLAAFLLEHSVLAREDARLRDSVGRGLSAGLFDHLRSHYQQPDEWTGQSITLEDATNSWGTAMRTMGLRVLSEQGEV